MAFFSWQSKFALGIKSIDNDHQKLVALIDRLYVAMSEGRAKHEIDDVVQELIDYTRFHFNREEVLMKSSDYADFEQHQKAHHTFVERVSQYQQKLARGHDNISVEVTSFLRDWLSNHIMVTDKALAPHLKERGVL